jgi:predicted TIM-barrel fold metal-dependent hydrolase
MLIDAHLHFKAQKCWPNAFRETLNAIYPRPASLPPSELNPLVLREDPEGKQLIKDMEHLGIDIAVNQTVDWGSAEGYAEEAELSIEEINQFFCQLAQKYPGKLYSFIGVHPRRHNAVDLLEKGVTSWGAKGLKLHPTLGFYPDDRICYRLYEKCVELGVPVTIHTGSGYFNMKYANPIYLDEPAKDFPTLQFIMAHVGGAIGQLWEEAVTVARGNPNISLDLSAVAPTVVKGGRLGNRGKYKDHIPMFIDMLDIMRNLLAGGCQNIMFGTDYPVYPIEVFEQWVNLFKNLPAVAAGYGYDFSQEEADQICYKNAARIMKLDIEGYLSPKARGTTGSDE